jgi:gliding motility-associated-like protein
MINITNALTTFLVMKNYFHFFIFFALYNSSLSDKLSAQVNIGGVINQYSAVTSFNACRNGYSVSNPGIFSVGDRVLMIQMKGSLIDQTNSPSFGNIASINASGLFEFAQILSINGNTITFVNELVNGISPGSTQLIKVPVYQNATVTSPLTCLPYNGSIGGVLVFEVNGTLTLSDNIDVSERGYRGGAPSLDEYIAAQCSSTDYIFPLNVKLGGNKGEGNSTITANIQTGRGPLSNGGGGGNHANAGGGGGGNRGSGGIGGNQWSACSSFANGGLGGRTLVYNNRIFMGGGGGGGQQNDGQGGTGKNGGGIIIIKANQITGNGRKIMSNGGDADLTTIDGAGGAGAGGSILLSVQNYSGNLAIEAKGGKGGNTNSGLTGTACFGPGGGGGGGLIRHSTNVPLTGVTTSVAGGAAGTVVFNGSTCFNTTYGATAGQAGAVIDTTILFESTFQYNPLVLTPVIDNISCVGLVDGAVEITSTGGKSPFLFSWTPNVSTTNTANGLAAGNYMVVVTQSNACKDTTTFIIQNPVPITLTHTVVDATCGFANGEIDVTATGGSGVFTYDWPGLGLTTSKIVGVPAGSHLVKVTDSKGCTAQLTINVALASPATPKPNLITPVYYCLNETPVPLSATPSTPTAVLNWYGISSTGTPQATPQTPSTNVVGTTWYYVTQTDNSCESFMDSIEVVVVSPPTVQATLTNPDCGYLNGAISVSVVGGGLVTYSWSPGNQTTSNLTALDTGKYVLTISYGNNCQLTENYTLVPGFIPDPVVVSPVSYCVNEPALPLQATASVNYSLLYLFSLTGTPQSAPIIPATNTVGTTDYYVLQKFNDCTSNLIPVRIIVKPLPQLTSPIQSVCAGNDAILTGTGADTYSWRIGGTLLTGNNIIITTLYDTTYTLIGELNGCIDSISSSVAVLVMPQPIINFTFSENLCETRSVLLEGNNDNAVYNSKWFYNDSLIGTGNIVNLPLLGGASGSHTIKFVLLSPNGCQDSSVIDLPLNPEDFMLKLYIPNSFTPNGDQVNDKWFAVGECFNEINYQIFNRWGEMLIESNNIDFKWDGAHNGKLLPTGIYFYVVTAKGYNYQDVVKRGQVNIIR